jgi:excisionase family DNA binding protein
MATGRPYLKIDELADYLNCPKSTAYRFLDAGKLPTKKIGAGLLIDRKALDLKLKNRRGGWRSLLEE